MASERIRDMLNVTISPAPVDWRWCLAEIAPLASWQWKFLDTLKTMPNGLYNHGSRL